MNASPRVLKEAKSQAKLQAGRMLGLYQRKFLKSWDDLARNFHIIIPQNYKDTPFTYASLSAFARQWEIGFEARLTAATTAAPAAETKVHVDKNTETFGEITLYPEQQGCYMAIYDALFVKKTKAIYQDGYTGSGKTPIALAVMCKAIREGILDLPQFAWRLHPFMVFTPKGVMEHWKREAERMGLGDLIAKRKIYVISESELATESGEIFAKEYEDDITGEVTLKWNPLMTPVLAILDEGHHYINPNSIRTRKILSLAESKFEKHFLWMSATPMEKVNDAYTFAITCDTRFMDMHVNKDTFKHFAGLLDATPEKPNREAVKRLRSVLSPFIKSIPYVKPKYKAINVVQLVDFRTENDRDIYKSAHERYIEACIKSGKNTMWGRFEKFIALNNYRKTVEPLRAWYIAAKCAENYFSGKLATACGTAFKETISRAIFELVDVHKIPREHISLIWGGGRQYKTEDLLTQQELDEVRSIKTTAEFLNLGPIMRKRIRITLRYLQDKHEHDETVEQQAYRHNKLGELRLLGKQGDNQRQIEIDKFQDGTSRICLFTLASGGVGLSFDRNKESLLPREGLFTPVYSGKEFQQVLGRLVRRASISDAIQRICMMKGTVEESHVAPILDEKLKCIAEITNRNFDIIDLLANTAPVATAPIKVRDVQAAEKDAEKDNTIVADFHSDNDDEDDDDNDILP